MNSVRDETEAQETGSPDSMLLDIPMSAHLSSWRLGGAPRFHQRCADLGIDLSKYKKLDDVYAEYLRIEHAKSD